MCSKIKYFCLKKGLRVPKTFVFKKTVPLKKTKHTIAKHTISKAKHIFSKIKQFETNKNQINPGKLCVWEN